MLIIPKDSIPKAKYIDLIRIKPHLKYMVKLLRNCLKLTESEQIQEFPNFNNK